MEKKKIWQGIKMHGIRGIIGIAAAAMVGLLLGRADVEGSIYPFGAAVTGAAFLREDTVNPYAVFAGVMAGLATRMQDMEDPAFRFSVVAFTAAAMMIMSAVKIKNAPITALAALGAAYVTATVIFRTYAILPVLLSVIELCSGVIMLLTLNTTVRVFAERPLKKVLADEEVVSFGFALMAVVLGLGKINVMGVYLRDITAVFLCLAAGRVGNAGLAAAVGAAAGTACILAGAPAQQAAAFAVASLIAAVLGRLGPIGMSVGFTAMYSLFGLYAIGGAQTLTGLISCVLGAGGFLAAPAKFYEYIAVYVDANVMRTREQSLHTKRFREVTTGRLMEISDVFGDAAKVFSERTEDKRSGTTYMYASIPEEACAGCVLFTGCWEKSFAERYMMLRRMYAGYCENGCVDTQTMGQKFTKHCVNVEGVLRAARKAFKEHDDELSREGKVMESRYAVAGQLRGISKIIETLSKEVQADIRFKTETEDRLRRALDRHGVRSREVCVQVYAGRPEITVSVNSCSAKGDCKGKILRAVSEACGMSMECVNTVCRNSRRCELVYEQRRRFMLKTGIASAVKSGSEVSGDSHSFGALKDGRYMLLLCDGMGSGTRAARESLSAVSLMEDFYRAGFDDDTALDVINKLLMISSEEDVFSTMDICMVDLVNGSMVSTKIGAPHSYIVRGDSVKKLSAGALPIGILDELRPARYRSDVQDGDIILMFTDGIADEEAVSEEIYEGMMSLCELANVQDIADGILALVLSRTEGRAKDDMTVIAARVVESRAEKMQNTA